MADLEAEILGQQQGAAPFQSGLLISIHQMVAQIWGTTFSIGTPGALGRAPVASPSPITPIPSPLPPAPAADGAIQIVFATVGIRPTDPAGTRFFGPTGSVSSVETATAFAVPGARNRNVGAAKWNIIANTLVAATSPVVLTLRRNGTDTTVTISVDDTTPTGVLSLPGSELYSPGDLLTWKLDHPAGDGVATRGIAGFLSYELA